MSIAMLERIQDSCVDHAWLCGSGATLFVALCILIVFSLILRPAPFHPAGKVVLISGGSLGIGRALAVRAALGRCAWRCVRCPNRGRAYVA